MNVLSRQVLEWKTPHEALFGFKPDISPYLAFYWWEPVYFTDPNNDSFPATKEKLGRIVGVAENQGDLMTWLILDLETTMVVTRSEVRTARNENNPNLRAEARIRSSGGESDLQQLFPASKLLKENLSQNCDDPPSEFMPMHTPDELVGMSYLKEMPDGQKLRAEVIKRIKDQEIDNLTKAKFLVELAGGIHEEIMDYRLLAEIIEKQLEEDPDDAEKHWGYDKVIGHIGPLNNKSPGYNGSSYNVVVLWKDGAKTHEPLDIMVKDDPVCMAKYAKDNGLLDTPGWKRLRQYAKNEKKLLHMVNQAARAAKKFNSAPKYKFGYRIPRNAREAKKMDDDSGKTLWQDAMDEEIAALNKYDTFINRGKVTHLPGYKKVPLNMIFDVKHDLRHRARLVAGGHKTDPTTEGTYSSVVSLRSLRLCILNAELNGLKIMVGDISSAYLESYTREKVCAIAGPEFGELEGCMLQISKALYGLRGSGNSWHRRFADTMRQMGFTPCKADGDVWMRDKGDHYEYVCVYVDDLMHMSRNPQEFYDELTVKYNYHLKGVGPPSYHLGGDFYRDDDGLLAWGARTYVNKMIMAYVTMFNGEPKEYSAPLDEKDHPELDSSPLLNADGVSKYQLMIGALQWAIMLGRFDIHVAVTTMSGFRVAPREGHVDRLKRIYGYLKKHPDAAIRFRTGIPQHEVVEQPEEYDWQDGVYSTEPEELPDDMPEPKGLAFRISTYEDANLMHDLITGKSMSGIIHLVN
jgi:hypothetical protein